MNIWLRGSCRGATPSVLAATQPIARRRLRADGGPGTTSPAKLLERFSTEHKIAAFSFALLVAGTVHAAGASEKTTGQGFAVPEEHPVTVELIAEHASIQFDGRTRVGVHFDLEEGWHIYWKEPGDAGLPTTIVWEGPSWVSFGPLHWPPPQQFQDPGDIRTHGYSGTVVLYSTLQCQLAAIVGQYPVPLTVHATVKWLACKELCVPGKAELELVLPVSDQPPVLSTHAEFFDHAE